MDLRDPGCGARRLLVLIRGLPADSNLRLSQLGTFALWDDQTYLLAQLVEVCSVIATQGDHGTILREPIEVPRPAPPETPTKAATPSEMVAFFGKGGGS